MGGPDVLRGGLAAAAAARARRRRQRRNAPGPRWRDVRPSAPGPATGSAHRPRRRRRRDRGAGPSDAASAVLAAHGLLDALEREAGSGMEAARSAGRRAHAWRSCRRSPLNSDAGSQADRIGRHGGGREPRASGLDGADGTAQDLRRLGLAQVLVEAQHHRGTLARAEGQDVGAKAVNEAPDRRRVDGACSGSGGGRHLAPPASSPPGETVRTMTVRTYASSRRPPRCGPTGARLANAVCTRSSASWRSPVRRTRSAERRPGSART